SGNPLIKYMASLDYLIHYPYGCAEQTTSGIFPLLFLKELGYATGRFGEKANAVDLFVQEGIKRLETMRAKGGLFTLWPGMDSYDRYLDQYVSHCLIEATQKGYKVNPQLLSAIYRFIGTTSATPVNTGRLDRSQQNLHEGEVDAYQLYLK